MRTFGMCVASVAGVLCLVSYVPAATLSLKIEPTTCTTVSSGGTVNYRITGTLSNEDGNLGLATFGVDVQTTTGIPQRPANSVDATKPFAPPFGYNPGGFGGTPTTSGNLLQVGGAQNTIHNPDNGGYPRSPRGTVVTGVGLTANTVLVAGQITLPSQPGPYTVSLANGFAGVLRSDGPYSGTSIYPVAAATVTLATGSFTVTVGSNPASPLSVDAGTGGWVYETMDIPLQASVDNPNQYPLTYAWAQTTGASGTLGGFNLLGLTFTAPEVQTLEQATVTLAMTASYDCTAQGSGSTDVRVRLMGDCYFDDTVDVVDLLDMVAAFGSSSGDANYNPLCDFNNDESVDVVDLLNLTYNFGRSLATGMRAQSMQQSATRVAADSAVPAGLREMNLHDALEYSGLLNVYQQYLEEHPEARPRQ